MSRKNKENSEENEELTVREMCGFETKKGPCKNFKPCRHHRDSNSNQSHRKESTKIKKKTKKKRTEDEPTNLFTLDSSSLSDLEKQEKELREKLKSLNQKKRRLSIGQQEFVPEVEKSPSPPPRKVTTTTGKKKRNKKLEVEAQEDSFPTKQHPSRLLPITCSNSSFLFEFNSKSKSIQHSKESDSLPKSSTNSTKQYRSQNGNCREDQKGEEEGNCSGGGNVGVDKLAPKEEREDQRNSVEKCNPKY